MSSISALQSFGDRLASLIGSGASSLDDAAFNRLALELFTIQFEMNEPLRGLCRARAITPQSIAAWQNIPAVPTQAFKELDITCIPPDSRTHVFHSSGTTAQRPSRHFHDGRSLALYRTSVLAAFDRRFGNSWRDLQAVCLSPPLEHAPRSSLAHMFHIVVGEGRAGHSFTASAGPDSTWRLDSTATLSALQSPGAKLVLGTAFSFVHLLDQLAATGLFLKLPPGSFVMETGGYKGRSRSIPKHQLHGLIRHHFGLPAEGLVVEYGMSELSSQAYSESGPPILTFPPWARVRILSPETGAEVADGKAGLIQVFDLANVYSSMGVQTEDMGIRRGAGFDLLGRAQLAEPRGCSILPQS